MKLLKYNKTALAAALTLALALTSTGCITSASDNPGDPGKASAYEEDAEAETSYSGASNEDRQGEKLSDNYSGSADASSEAAYFPEFSSVDIYGNKIDNSLFEENKITAVNIWGTFCGPCIAEMPDLAKWDSENIEGMGIVGIVCDINGADDTDYIKQAVSITENAGVTYTNIIPDSSLQTYLRNFAFVPTTVFVDSDGKIVGEPIVGANVDGYKSFVNSYLSE